MKTKIHNLREYSPSEVESFRQRMEAEEQRQEEYNHLDNDRPPLMGVLILYVLFLALVGLVIYYCWGASDRLVGIGS